VWFAAGKPAAAGVLSPAAVSLMEGVVRAMYLTKIKWAAGMLVVGAALGIGVGLWAVRPATADPLDKKRDDSARAVPKPADDGQPAGRVQTVQRPLGTWERDIGPQHLALRIDTDHLYGALTFAEKDKKITFNVDADYSVTRDSVVYGVITGADVAGAENAENGELFTLAAQLPDQPFSARCRVDGNTLTIKDVKFGGGSFNSGNNKGQDALVILIGRYKKKPTATEEAP
jgi:hypothetical protein